MNDFAVSDADMQFEDDRDALRQFWKALIAGQHEQALQIYHSKAAIRLPQTGERIIGRAKIAAHGLLESGERLVKVNGIVGGDGLWVSECEVQRNRQASLLVSVVEMNDGKIVRETRYRVPKNARAV